MKGGTLIYKCRHCNAYDRSIQVPNLISALTLISRQNTIQINFVEGNIGITKVHACQNGYYVIADCFGGQEDIN